MKICSVHPAGHSYSETFIESFVQHFPGDVHVLQGNQALYGSTADRILQQICYQQSKLRHSKSYAIKESYLKAFQRLQPQAVFAQFGPIGADVQAPCQRMNLPLLVFFRGYDATQHHVIERNTFAYKQLFQTASAFIATAPSIRDALIELGAPEDKIYICPSGANCELFCGANPSKAKAHFLSVGRFVPKKAPQRTLQAFAQARIRCHWITLTMIGDGPLLTECQTLAQELGIGSAVRFCGAQSHQQVAEEMCHARAFLQHSVVALDGDSEGTPVSVIEAGASGLPVIATRHAGIPEVVVNEETGVLVDEYDVSAMSDAIVRLAQDPALASRFGMAAQERIRSKFCSRTAANTVFSIAQRLIQSQAAAS